MKIPYCNTSLGIWRTTRNAHRKTSHNTSLVELQSYSNVSSEILLKLLKLYILTSFHFITCATSCSKRLHTCYISRDKMDQSEGTVQTSTITVDTRDQSEWFNKRLTNHNPDDNNNDKTGSWLHNRCLQNRLAQK